MQLHEEINGYITVQSMRHSEDEDKLLRGAQRKYKKQWTQAAAWQIPNRHIGKFLRMSNQALKQAAHKGSKTSVLGGVQNLTQQNLKQPGLTFETSPTLSTRLKWMPFRVRSHLLLLMFPWKHAMATSQELY